MKQSVKTTDPVWGTFHATNCPAGCMTCSAAKDHSVAKFTRTLLPEAQLLPQADYPQLHAWLQSAEQREALAQTRFA